MLSHGETKGKHVSFESSFSFPHFFFSLVWPKMQYFCACKNLACVWLGISWRERDDGKSKLRPISEWKKKGMQIIHRGSFLRTVQAINILTAHMLGLGTHQGPLNGNFTHALVYVIEWLMKSSFWVPPWIRFGAIHSLPGAGFLIA